MKNLLDGAAAKFRVPSGRSRFQALAVALMVLVGSASAQGAVRPPNSEVLQLRSAAFTERGDIWYLECPSSGPWVQYTFIAARNFAPTLKLQKLTVADLAGSVSERYEITFSGRPAYYYLARDRQWLDFGNPLSLTYHATLAGTKWHYVLDASDTPVCGIGEPQRNPALLTIPPLAEPLRVK